MKPENQSRIFYLTGWGLPKTTMSATPCPITITKVRISIPRHDLSNSTDDVRTANQINRNLSSALSCVSSDDSQSDGK
jgi:hypothetical protein